MLRAACCRIPLYEIKRAADGGACMQERGHVVDPDHDTARGLAAVLGRGRVGWPTPGPGPPKAHRFPALELGAIYPLTQIGRIVSPSHLWSRANLRGDPYPPPAAPHRTVATRPLRGS